MLIIKIITIIMLIIKIITVIILIIKIVTIIALYKNRNKIIIIIKHIYIYNAIITPYRSPKYCPKPWAPTSHFCLSIEELWQNLFRFS
jgi:hypothetical protein